MASKANSKSKPEQRRGAAADDDDSEDEVFFGASTEKELVKAERYRKRRTEYYCPDFRASRVSIFGPRDQNSGTGSFGQDDANIVHEDQDDNVLEDSVEEAAKDSPEDEEIGSKSTENLDDVGGINSSYEDSINEPDTNRIETANDSLVIHQRRSLLVGVPSRGGSIGSARDSLSDVMCVRESSVYGIDDEPEEIEECQSAVSSECYEAPYVTADSGFPTGVEGTSGVVDADRDGSGSGDDSVIDGQQAATESDSSLPLIRLSEVELCLDEAKTGSIKTDSSLNESSRLSDFSTNYATYLSECRLSINKSQCYERNSSLSHDYAAATAANDESSMSLRTNGSSITSLEEAQLAELIRQGMHAGAPRQTGFSVMNQTDDRSSIPGDSLNSTSASSLDVVAATMATIRRERMAESPLHNNATTEGGSATKESWYTAPTTATSFSMERHSQSSIMVDCSLWIPDSTCERSSEMTRDSLDSTSASDGSTLSSLDVVAATMASLQRERLACSPQKILGSQISTDESWHSTKTVTSSSTADSSASVGDDKVRASDVVSATMATIERERVANSPRVDARSTSESWHTAKTVAQSTDVSLSSSRPGSSRQESLPVSVESLSESMARASISAGTKMESDDVCSEERNSEESWHTTSIAVDPTDPDCSVLSSASNVESAASKSTEESWHTSNTPAATTDENDDRMITEQDGASYSRRSHDNINDSVSSIPLPIDTFDIDDGSIGDSSNSIREEAQSTTAEAGSPSNVSHLSPITIEPAARSFITESDSKLVDGQSPHATSLRSYSAHSASRHLDSTGRSLDPRRSSLRRRHYPDSTSVYESCDNGDDSVVSYNQYISCSSTVAVDDAEVAVAEDDENEHPGCRTPPATRPSATRRISTTPRRIRPLATGGATTPSSTMTADDSLPGLSTSLQFESNVEDEDLSGLSKLSFQSPPPQEHHGTTISCQTSFRAVPTVEIHDSNDTSSQTSFQVSSTGDQTSEHGMSDTGSQTSFETPSEEPASEASSGSRLAVPAPATNRIAPAGGSANRGRQLVVASPRGALQSPRDNGFKAPVGRAIKSPSVPRNVRQLATPSPTGQSPRGVNRILAGHKTARYDNIVSPIGQYINDNPPPPLITNVRQNNGRSRLPIIVEKKRPDQPVRQTAAAISPYVLGPSASPNFAGPSPTSIPLQTGKKGTALSASSALRATRSRCKENVEVSNGGFRVPQQPSSPAPRSAAARKGSAGRDDSGLLLEQSILETFGVKKDELAGKLRRDVISHVRKELTRREKVAIEQSKLNDRPSDIPVLPYAIYEEPAALASVQKTWDLMTKVHTVKNSKLPVPSPRPIVMKHTGNRKKLQWANAVMATPETFSSPNHPIRSNVTTILVKQGQCQGEGEPAKPTEGEVDVSMVEVHRSASSYTAGKMKQL